MFKNRVIVALINISFSQAKNSNVMPLFKTNLALYNKHVHVLFVNMFIILMSQTINISFKNDCIFGILILLKKDKNKSQGWWVFFKVRHS